MRKTLYSIALGLCFFIIHLFFEGLPMGLTRTPKALAADSYTFGVVPQFEQRKLYAIWQPILDELEKRTGLAFSLKTTVKIQDFEKELCTSGGFDFIYTNPYHVLRLRKTQAYQPLVRDKAPLRGILVVAKEGPIKTLKDLDGKTVAFPTPNALGASLLMRADLERVHHIEVTPVYVKTHSSVYLHVIKGLTLAGGGVEKTLQEQDADIRNGLQVLYTTRDMPSHPIAAHPRVPAADALKVRAALLAMATDPVAKQLLVHVPIKQLIATSLDDYLVMADWDLEKYWEPVTEE